MEEHINLNLDISNETKQARFTIERGKNNVFQFTIGWEDFCKLTADMQRVIKDINLKEIREYEQRKAEPVAGMCFEDNVESTGNSA